MKGEGREGRGGGELSQREEAWTATLALDKLQS